MEDGGEGRGESQFLSITFFRLEKGRWKSFSSASASASAISSKKFIPLFKVKREWEEGGSLLE